MPIFGGEKPFTSVTVKINQLCTPNRNSDLADDSMEIYLDQLISLIKLQNTGAAEAARAIRKKIKYGNSAEEMLLASNLLELMVLNAGPKIGRVIASDDKLAELLRGIVGGHATTGAGTAYDAAVIRRFRNLALGWRSEFQDLEGYKPLAGLWRAVPRKKKTPDLNQGEWSPEPENAASHKSPPPRPRTMSPYTLGKEKPERPAKSRENADADRDGYQGWGFPRKPGKKQAKSGKAPKGGYADEEYKIPQINYKVEAPKIRNTIASCHTHTTALNNILLALPEGENPENDPRAAAEFDKCRKIRRSILRYLQFVGAGHSTEKRADIVELDDEFLGALIGANDQLVTVFTKFDQMAGYTQETPASYHDDSSSAESYYSSDESLNERVDDLRVQESSSRLAEAVERPPVVRSNTAFSVGTVGTAGTAGSDPFGDRNAF